jgi:inositol phosphorylceramide mannosyltransferase catalytic subunit
MKYTKDPFKPWLAIKQEQKVRKILITQRDILMDVVFDKEFIVNKNFEAMIMSSYDFNQSIYEKDSRWGILGELYDKNFIHVEECNFDTLPKKIHQIWLGGNLPLKYKKYTESWKRFNPDWEYKLWIDKDVNDVEIPNRTLFESINNLGQKSDFLRYHILNQFGGIYADTDFECLRSFNSLSYVDFIGGVGFPSRIELYIGLIGCVPHHPIMEQIVNGMDKIRDGGWPAIFETTGTYFFTRTFFKVVTEYQKGIVMLPPDYFYPFPNQGGHENRKGRDYIKDCSYAVHHWAVSWGHSRK